MSIRFEWDSAKALRNHKDHGVSFPEAVTVFYDDSARLLDDPEHSDTEERFLMMGLSGHLRILVVCHCYRENDNVIRLISARKATKNEARSYRGNQ